MSPAISAKARVWAPVGVPTVWSLPVWLDGNPWEFEDGPTRRRLAQGADWDLPSVWLDDARIAIWNVANWDDDGFGDCVPAPGVAIFNITEPEPDEGHGGQIWPMPDLPAAKHLHYQNGQLLVVGANQSWVWDANTRELLAHQPDFAPQCFHQARGELIEWSEQTLRVDRWN